MQLLIRQNTPSPPSRVHPWERLIWILCPFCILGGWFCWRLEPVLVASLVLGSADNPGLMR